MHHLQLTFRHMLILKGSVRDLCFGGINLGDIDITYKNTVCGSFTHEASEGRSEIYQITGFCM